MYNCMCCQRPKYCLDEHEKPILGQNIKCAYEGCGKIFSQVLCPDCKRMNYFPFDPINPVNTFNYAMLKKCSYIDCQVEFLYYICPVCHCFSFKKNTQEGITFVCKCKNQALCWGCPFCHLNIFAINSNLRTGHMVRCPNPKCMKKYAFLRCPDCHHLIFSREENEVLLIEIL